MNIRVTLNCQLKPEKTDKLFGFLIENLPNVRNFEGCLSVDVLFDEENREMLLEEQWESIEHHQNYINFISNNRVLNELSNFLETLPQIKYFKKAEL